MVDPVDDVAQALARLTSDFDVFGVSILSLNDSSLNAVGSIESPTGAWANFYDRVNALANSATAYTADIEFAMTEARLQTKIPAVHINPINYSTDLFSVIFEPDNQIFAGWNRPGYPPFRGAFFLDVPFELYINGNLQDHVLLRVEAFPVLDATAGNITLTLASSPRFLNFDGTESSILLRVPRENDSYEDVVKKIYDGVDSFLSATLIPIPKAPASFPFPAVPHTYRITDTFISFVARSRPMRRTRNLLISIMDGSFSECARISKDVATDAISSQPGKFGAQFVSMSFGWGSFLLTVTKHFDEGECWVGVHVDIWPTYNVGIYSDVPGRLLALADMTSYRYQINIDNCWPFCDQIMDKAKAKIKEEIPNYQHQAFSFADLRGYAYRVAGHIDPYGILVLMEPVQ